jgi:hypothetical protein
MANDATTKEVTRITTDHDGRRRTAGVLPGSRAPVVRATPAFSGSIFLVTGRTPTWKRSAGTNGSAPSMRTSWPSSTRMKR